MDGSIFYFAFSIRCDAERQEVENIPIILGLRSDECFFQCTPDLPKVKFNLVTISLCNCVHNFLLSFLWAFQPLYQRLQGKYELLLLHIKNDTARSNAVFSVKQIETNFHYTQQ